MSTKILERAEVCAKVRLTFPAIWARMLEGTFPRPVELGKRKVAWLEEEIDAWIKAQPRRKYKGDPGHVTHRHGKPPRKQRAEAVAS
jgi:prophage regulatory protein